MSNRNNPSVTRALAYGAWLTLSSPRVWFRVWLASMVTAGIAALTLYAMIAEVLNHSRASLALVDTFNPFALGEVLQQVRPAFGGLQASLLLAIVLFLAFYLFLEGGVLATYWGRASGQGRPTAAQFYANGITYFWRMVRLALFALLPLVVAMMLRGILVAIAAQVREKAPNEHTGIHVTIIMVAIGQMMFLVVRLWHDMSQVHAVAENETAMRRSFVRGFKLTFGNFVGLFSLQLATSLVGTAIIAVGVLTWKALPAHAVVPAIILAQVTLALFIGARLWQRAAQTAWYQRYAEWSAPVAHAPTNPVVIDAITPLDGSTGAPVS